MATTPRPVSPAEGTATSTISSANVRRKLSSSMGTDRGMTAEETNRPGVPSALPRVNRVRSARASRPHLATPTSGALHPGSPAGRYSGTRAGWTTTDMRSGGRWVAAAVVVTALAGAVACSGGISQGGPPDGGVVADGGCGFLITCTDAGPDSGPAPDSGPVDSGPPP